MKTILTTPKGNIPKNHIIRDGYFEIPLESPLIVEGEMLKCWDIPIAVKSKDKIYLDSSFWEQSNLILKYLSQFLGEQTFFTCLKVNGGEYITVNLKDVS